MLPAQDSGFSAVRSRIQEKVDSGAATSIAIVAAKNGQLPWEEAFGWADVDKKIRATPQTVYPLASLSKSMTATAMMVLVEREQVFLDDPVKDYIAPHELRNPCGDPAEVSVRSLLDNTSGIPMGWAFINPHHPPDFLATEEFSRRFGIAATPPGRTYHYSNLGFGEAERLIEIVSEEGFAEFMRREVFLAPPGGGGILASIHDLYRYGMFHLIRSKIRPSCPALEAETNSRREPRR